MKAGRTFAAYRYFLIPSEQISIYDTAKEKRREAVEKFFYRAINEKKVSFDIDDRKQVLAFEREITNTVLLFKFGSEKHETKYRESETGIESVVEANLPFVYLIFDIERQLLLLEVNTSVFKNVMQGQNKIQKWFEQAFFQYGFEIIFEEIIDENTFWKYVEDGSAIYDGTITLNSPNLFTGFIEIGNALKKIRAVYNNTQTTLSVSNKNAPLTGIQKENEELSAAVKYASAGGGEWALTKRTRSGKRTYRSRNKIKKVNVIPVSVLPNKEDLEELDKDILEALDSVETIMPKQKTEG